MKISWVSGVHYLLLFFAAVVVLPGYRRSSDMTGQHDGAPQQRGDVSNCFVPAAPYAVWIHGDTVPLDTPYCILHASL